MLQKFRILSADHGSGAEAPEDGTSIWDKDSISFLPSVPALISAAPKAISAAFTSSKRSLPAQPARGRRRGTTAGVLLGPNRGRDVPRI